MVQEEDVFKFQQYIKAEFDFKTLVWKQKKTREEKDKQRESYSSSGLKK